MTDTRRILAIDPAALTGYAHSSGHHGTWDIGTSSSRLGVLRDLLLKAVAEWGVDLFAFEDASFGSRNPAIQAMHNELRGIIRMVASEVGAKTVKYHPTTIKKFATGNGRAKKPQMIAACKMILGITPRDDNEADALWILEAARQGYLPPKESARRMLRKVKNTQSRFKFR